MDLPGNYYASYLYHWGIKGQKWGLRRFRNEDGTLTEAGKRRYMKKGQYYKLSDEELESAIKRLNMEKTLKNAYDDVYNRDKNEPKKESEAKKIALNVLEKWATASVTKAVESHFAEKARDLEEDREQRKYEQDQAREQRKYERDQARDEAKFKRDQMREELSDVHENQLYRENHQTSTRLERELRRRATDQDNPITERELDENLRLIEKWRKIENHSTSNNKNKNKGGNK